MLRNENLLKVTRKNRLRYSRERALQTLTAFGKLILSRTKSCEICFGQSLAAARRLREPVGAPGICVFAARNEFRRVIRQKLLYSKSTLENSSFLKC